MEPNGRRTARDWLPAKLVDRMLSRRGRLHAFETLDARRTALSVIDLTVLFASDAPNVNAVIENVNQLAAALRAAGGTVAWVRPQPATDTPLMCAILGAGPAAHYHAANGKGDPRAALHPDLVVRPGDLQASKTLYSAFFPGACDLAEQLTARGADTVLIAGAISNVCCEASARDAFSRGFQVIMLADASLGNEAEHCAALAAIYRNFGDVRTVGEALALLAGA